LIFEEMFKFWISKSILESPPDKFKIDKWNFEIKQKFSETLLTISSIVIPIYLGIGIIKEKSKIFTKIGFIILMLGLACGILYLNTIGGGTSITIDNSNQEQLNESVEFNSKIHFFLSELFFKLQWWMTIFGYTACLAYYSTKQE